MCDKNNKKPRPFTTFDHNFFFYKRINGTSDWNWVIPQICNFIKKESLARVFSCEFCEISKKTFFHKTPLVATSVLSLNTVDTLSKTWILTGSYTLRKKCPYLEFFGSHVFPHWDWVQRDIPYFSIFSLNAEKHGPENLCFSLCCFSIYKKHASSKIKVNKKRYA